MADINVLLEDLERVSSILRPFEVKIDEVVQGLIHSTSAVSFMEISLKTSRIPQF